MKVTVTVRPRDGILDPQGEALRRSLAGLGYAASRCARARCSTSSWTSTDAGRGAPAGRAEIAEPVLANPLIEQFEVERPRGVPA